MESEVGRRAYDLYWEVEDGDWPDLAEAIHALRAAARSVDLKAYQREYARRYYHRTASSAARDGPGTPRGSLHAGAKLSEVDVPLIRGLLASGLPASRIADAWGVSLGTIANINNGHSWRHVTGSAPVRLKPSSWARLPSEQRAARVANIAAGRSREQRSADAKKWWRRKRMAATIVASPAS